jgi:hypothetical protein
MGGPQLAHYQLWESIVQIGVELAPLLRNMPHYRLLWQVPEASLRQPRSGGRR